MVSATSARTTLNEGFFFRTGRTGGVISRRMSAREVPERSPLAQARDEFHLYPERTTARGLHLGRAAWQIAVIQDALTFGAIMPWSLPPHPMNLPRYSLTLAITLSVGFA